MEINKTVANGRPSRDKRNKPPLNSPFVSILMLIVPLFVGSFLLPVEALAQNEVLSQAAISEYTAKLARFRNIQMEIADRVACLEKRDAELTSRSNALEIELGNLRRREQALAGELATQRAKQESFEKAFKSEQDNYIKLEQELDHYQAQKWAEEEAVRQCKHNLSTGGIFDWFTNAACDFADTTARLVGAIESVEGKIDSSVRQLQIVRDGLNGAEQRLDDSQKALALVQAQAVEVQASVRKTENEIQPLKTTLSDLRTEVQNYLNLLDDFANALAEANSVDTADARARTARKVIRISDDVDKAVARVVDPANSVLPEGWRQNCLPR